LWQDTTSSRSPTQYHAAVMRVMQQFNVPGAVAGVWRPGDIPWREAFGVADIASGRAMTLADHFPIGSITKSFTVTVVFQLARDGVLSMDDPIGKYVPGIPDGDRITLTHLAAMESGVKSYTAVTAFVEKFAQDLARPWTNAEIVSYAVPESPVFDPGLEYNYSNTNTVLLGMAVETATLTPLGRVMQTRIFDPLGLANTAYPLVIAPPDPHPSPYLVSLTTREQIPVDLVNPTALGPSGAMTSTLDDLALWAEALGTGRLLTRAQQSFRLSHARVATDGPTYDNYGVGIGEIHGWWGHTGSGLGFQAAAFHDPRTRTIIATIVNASPLDDTPHSPDDEDRRELNIAEEIFIELEKVVSAG